MTTNEAFTELRNPARLYAETDYLSRRFAATVCTCDPFAPCDDCTYVRRLAAEQRRADELGALRRR